MSGPLETVLGSPIWRHAITLIIVGIAWGTMQADIAYTQESQDKITEQQQEFVRAIESLKGVLNDLRVNGATTQQQVKNLETQFEGINRKLDTLIWRTQQLGPDGLEER